MMWSDIPEVICAMSGVVTSFCTEGKLGIFAFPLQNINIALSLTQSLEFLGNTNPNAYNNSYYYMPMYES